MMIIVLVKANEPGTGEATLRIKTSILALLACAMASFLLVHFMLIWAYGRFYIYETNRLLLISEITLAAVIIGFSSYCFIEQLRKPRNR